MDQRSLRACGCLQPHLPGFNLNHETGMPACAMGLAEAGDLFEDRAGRILIAADLQAGSAHGGHPEAAGVAADVGATAASGPTVPAGRVQKRSAP